MRKLILIFLTLLFVIFPNTIHAQAPLTLPENLTLPTPVSSEGWYINSFSSGININEDGSIIVSEKIIVDFKDLEKHGIFRDIPVVYRGTNDIYTEINVHQVLQDGKKATVQTSRNGDFLELKIGDADKTISGVHTYEIVYLVRGVLKGFADYDELYWNVTGNDWPVPILSSFATITLPQDGVIKYKCFEGPSSSQITNCRTEQISEREINVQSSRPLNAYEGLTVVLGYNKGMVPLLVIEKPKTLFDKFFSVPSLLLLAITFFGGIFLVITLWWKKGRDFHFQTKELFDKNSQERIKPLGSHETIVVEYTPPEKLKPAELGVLIDEKADTLDVTATIIDLATHGYLSIKEISKGWIFGKTDYELTQKAKDKSKLLGYEKELLTRLFDDGNKVKISELKKTFYTDLAKVKTQLYDDVQKKKLFSERPDQARTKYFLLAILTMVGGVILFVISTGGQFIYGVDIGFSLFIVGVVLLAMTAKMPRRTAFGRELYRRVKGYELFISTAEKHKQKFFEDNNLFNEILPYAIVFGLTEKFAKAMREMGIKPENPTWYSGAHAFNASTFSSNVSDFSNSFSTAIASTPSSSGGFSGGGSSGGGFGGGGGGSW